MFLLMGLHDSIGPWSWPRTMVYSDHDLVCIKRFSNLEFVWKHASINFEHIPPFVLMLNY
jgi:hypothetical protein